MKKCRGKFCQAKIGQSKFCHSLQKQFWNEGKYRNYHISTKKIFFVLESNWYITVEVVSHICDTGLIWVNRGSISSLTKIDLKVIGVRLRYRKLLKIRIQVDLLHFWTFFSFHALYSRTSASKIGFIGHARELVFAKWNFQDHVIFQTLRLLYLTSKQLGTVYYRKSNFQWWPGLTKYWLLLIRGHLTWQRTPNV